MNRYYEQLEEKHRHICENNAVKDDKGTSCGKCPVRHCCNDNRYNRRTKRWERREENG